MTLFREQPQHAVPLAVGKTHSGGVNGLFLSLIVRVQNLGRPAIRSPFGVFLIMWCVSEWCGTSECTFVLQQQLGIFGCLIAVDRSGLFNTRVLRCSG